MRRSIFFLILSFCAAGCALIEDGAGNNQNTVQTRNFLVKARMDRMAEELTGAKPGAGIICPKCGRQFDAEADVCPYDGAALRRAQ